MSEEMVLSAENIAILTWKLFQIALNCLGLLDFWIWGADFQLSYLCKAMVCKNMVNCDISCHFDENEILKLTPLFEFFNQKMALLTPALLTPALFSATRKNNADLGPAL